MFHKPFEAVIFDLDGVITDTRKFHYASWKESFDNYLGKKGINHSFEKDDYASFVDGRPRNDGIKAFLKSLRIIPDPDTILSIAEEKNASFLKHIQDEQLEIFPDALALIDRLKKYHFKLAVVSSSQNGRLILRRLKILDIFEACIDGSDGLRLNLRGKPHPDYFLEAAKKLGVIPGECVVIEDAVAGVAAGRNGHFKYVYGIGRNGQTPLNQLLENGADFALSSLNDFGSVPNALDVWSKINLRLQNKEPALFIDFDGTLSEIAPTPHDAYISEAAKRALFQCSKSMRVAIISGRDRVNVKNLVGINDIFYAGCHGFDISGPGCFHYSIDSIQNSKKSLELITLKLESFLAKFPGIIVEKKDFGTAIHYRLTPESFHGEIIKKLDEMIKEFPDLKLKDGKKVFEIVPNIKWGKGEAIKKLSEILNLDLNRTELIFIGDDKTDEEAFVELKGHCICIRVDETGHAFTNADYFLRNPYEVTLFLTRLVQSYAGNLKKWRLGA